jgi:tRNA threonylcarbamoyl adenosine modification protein (Sua5/YciO/YrdC/YwlC family)
MIVEWDPERPKKKATELIKTSILNGDIIAYPTDTYYGLGCDLFNIKAIKKLYFIRGLDEKRPLSIIFNDLKEISNYAVLTDFAFQILKRSLPGAYTFILMAKRIVPRLMMSTTKEVGVRMPDHPVPAGITSLVERPIINTSAKPPGGDVLSDPRDIERRFRGNVSLVIDGGVFTGEPSTVISLVDDEVTILREGKGSIRNLHR